MLFKCIPTWIYTEKKYRNKKKNTLFGFGITLNWNMKNRSNKINGAEIIISMKINIYEVSLVESKKQWVCN